MIATTWLRVHRWLALGLMVALVLEGFTFAVVAGDDGDDDDGESAAEQWESDEDDWETEEAPWAGEGGEGGDDDDGRGDRRANSRRSDRGNARTARTQSTAPIVQGDDGDDDDDDDGCEIEDDDADPEGDGFCANQVIVRLATNADVHGIHQTFDTATIDAVDGQPLFLLQMPRNSAGDEASFAAGLEADERVNWAELNFVDQAPEGSPRRFYLRGGDVPQASALSQSYAPGLIGSPAAQTCATGSGVTVAVIDSGLDPDHPAFDGTAMDAKDAWNAFSAQDGLGNVDDIGNSEDDDGDGIIDEMAGHGTHVSGIVTQIAPGAALMPIKALDSDGVGQAFYLARAIYRARDRGADVINLSLGSTADTRIVREATDAAKGAGIFVAAAAGNAGPSGPREYPATSDGVFGVASTDRQDRVAEFSSTHASIALSAPGDGIVSAFPIDQPPDNKLGSPYAIWSGTSMATPWVAGAAALVRERHPAWSPDDIANRLRDTAAPIIGSANGMGSGRLDVAAAIGCDSQPQAGEDAQNDGKGKKGKNKKNKRKNRR